MCCKQTSEWEEELSGSSKGATANNGIQDATIVLCNNTASSLAGECTRDGFAVRTIEAKDMEKARQLFDGA
jgi:hypothetical protein